MSPSITTNWPELKADLDSGELDAAQYEDARREIEKRLSEDVPAELVPVAAAHASRWPGYALAGGDSVVRNRNVCWPGQSRSAAHVTRRSACGGTARPA